MQTVAAEQDANNNGQKLTKPESIYRLLKKLADQRIRLKIRFDTIEGIYNSQILAANLQERFFILDEITPAWGHKAAIKGDALSFEGMLDGCRITFGEVQALAKGEREGNPIYKFPFPQELLYEQRRKTYRTPVRRSLNIVAEVPLDEHGGALTALLRDISIQGCQLEFGGDLREQLTTGSLLDECVMIFPSQQTIPFGIEVRHAGYDAEENRTLCGCRFINLSPMAERKIALCVTELQREIARVKALGPGSGPVSELFKPKQEDAPAKREPSPGTKSTPQLSKEIKSEIDELKRHNDRLRYQQLQAEIRRQHSTTINLVKNLITQVKLEQPLDLISAVQERAAQLVELVERHPNDLLCMGRIRHRDNYLTEHSVNTAVLLILFGRHLGFEQTVLAQIAAGGLLHDIGKALIPDQIHYKPGKLSDDEMAIMHQHVAHTATLLAPHALPKPCLAIALQNCERIDGSGYPNGLRGDAISLYGRMAAIVDAYDAMTADRSYSHKLSPPLALKKLLQEADTHYDKTLVHKFIRCMGIYPIGTLVRFSNNELGFVIKLNRDTLQPATVRMVYSAAYNRHLSPVDIDLTDPETARRYGKIQGSDNPDAYNINTAILRAAI